MTKSNIFRKKSSHATKNETEIAWCKQSIATEVNNKYARHTQERTASFESQLMNMYDEGGADLAVSLIGLVQSVNENHGREHVMQLGQ